MPAAAPALDSATRTALVAALGRAHSVLRHRALRDGILVVERDRAQRVRLERDAFVDYWDTAPLRAAHATALRARLAEGRFGRP